MAPATTPTTCAVTMTVNGETVHARVEPRQHLADFVRRDLGLTGTHISCEHGVCGACTVLIDGMPQRSCITFAAACEGAQVTTIEGYDGDAVMTALRRAFHEHHALQCGYCTPGMLCTGRDIVLRLPGPDARRVRHELAGNLCRCTGYVGIVEAIDAVLAQKAAGVLAMPSAAALVAAHEAPVAASSMAATNPPAGPSSADTSSAGALPAAAASVASPHAARARTVAASDPSGLDDADWTPIAIDADGEWIEVRQALTAPADAAATWRCLADLPLVARCLPGATILEHRADRARGLMTIKFGPISAAFAMRAELALDPAARSGTMRAEGSDQRSATRVKTLLDYRVLPLDSAQSRIELVLRFRLAGPLAQFSRAGLVNDYVAEMTRLFGVNLGAAIGEARGQAGGDAPASRPGEAHARAAPAQGPSLLRLLLARLRRWFGAGS